MRSPTRRSKKIGLTQGGRLKDGRAYEKDSRAFSADTWERLSTQKLPRWHVITENPSRDYFHPATGAEIHGVLAHLPAHLTRDVRVVVLRRMPKLDERLWIDARLRHCCVILNSFPKSMQTPWPGQPSASDRRFYSRWSEDWSQQGNVWYLKWTHDAAKSYYLYYLLLHEVGHIHQPRTTSLKRREGFADSFALDWEQRIPRLPPA